MRCRSSIDALKQTPRFYKTGVFALRFLSPFYGWKPFLLLELGHVLISRGVSLFVRILVSVIDTKPGIKSGIIVLVREQHHNGLFKLRGMGLTLIRPRVIEGSPVES
jgi:hypothetical protein